ncbi:hypothetical protein BD560DRAFT_87559 [Blakeslea trispora]|nr:hypothetical protein BD560DRAFT_87559 [Blakeslea trispora]
MNQKFCFTAVMSVVFLFFLFIIHSAIRLSQSTLLPERADHSLYQAFEKREALVTILDDRSMLEPTWTSLYSLRNKKPLKSDIVVLLSDTIELERDEVSKFESLDTKLIRTSALEHLGNRKTTSDFNGIMTQLWAMLSYKKIIYFTVDVLFEDNVDQLFNHPAGTALISNQNDRNASISFLVLKPDARSFEKIITDYRRSEQDLTLIDLLQGEYLTPASYRTFKQVKREIYIALNF